MHITILTGASRGMGLGMASQRIAQGHRLLTLQRKPNSALNSAAETRGSMLEQWSADLTDPGLVADRLHAWLTALPAALPAALPTALPTHRHGIQSLTLINNAALIATPSGLANANRLELGQALRSALEAPLLLTAAFLSATDGWTCPRKVLNISSGLGRRAMAGAAGYCAAKAGMDHFSRAAALEEAAKPNGARIVSLAPGVIDTDMQVQLRGADPAQFADRVQFERMKTDAQLLDIDAAAARVLAWLDQDSFGSEPVADVR